MYSTEVTQISQFCETKDRFYSTEQRVYACLCGIITRILQFLLHRKALRLSFLWSNPFLYSTELPSIDGFCEKDTLAFPIEMCYT